MNVARREELSDDYNIDRICEISFSPRAFFPPLVIYINKQVMRRWKMEKRFNELSSKTFSAGEGGD